MAQIQFSRPQASGRPGIPLIVPSVGVPAVQLPRFSPADFGAGAFREVTRLGNQMMASEAREQAEALKALKEFEAEVQRNERLVASNHVADVFARLEIGLKEDERALRETTDRQTYLEAVEESIKQRQKEYHEATKGSPHAVLLAGQYAQRLNRLIGEHRINAQIYKAGLDKQEIRGGLVRALGDTSRLIGEETDPEKRRDLVARGVERINEALESGAINATEAAQQIERFKAAGNAAIEAAWSARLGPALDNLINQAYRQPENARVLAEQGAQQIFAAGSGYKDRAEITERVTKFRDALWHGAIKSLIERDPIGARKDLQAGIYDAELSQGSLMRLDAEAQNEIEKRERVAEAARKESVRQIGKAVDDYKTAVLLGFKWAGNEEKLAAAVRGTEHEAEFQNARAASAVLGKFNQMAPTEQEQFLREVRSGAQTGDSAKFVKSLEAAHQATRRALNDDALSFAVQQGVIENLPELRLDDGGASFRERSRLAGIAEQRYGVPVSPLTDDEAAALVQQFNSMPTSDAKVGLLRSVTQGLEDRHVKAIAGQLAKQKRTLMAYAMGMSVEAPQVASRLIQGHEILKENKDVLPKGVDMQTARSRIAAAVGEAYQRNPEHFAAVSEAALNLYALKSWQEQDLSGTIDTRRLDAAIQEATGGVISYKGRTIQAPAYGVDESVFLDLLERADYSKAKGFSKKDILRHGVLESVGSGRYVVRVGAGYVQSTDSRAFILDLAEVLSRAGRAGASIGGVAGMIQ